MTENSGKSLMVGLKKITFFGFQGLDAFDYLHADVILTGTIPPLDRIGTKVRVEDYVEKFTR